MVTTPDSSTSSSSMAATPTISIQLERVTPTDTLDQVYVQGHDRHSHQTQNRSQFVSPPSSPVPTMSGVDLDYATTSTLPRQAPVFPLVNLALSSNTTPNLNLNPEDASTRTPTMSRSASSGMLAGLGKERRLEAFNTQNSNILTKQQKRYTISMPQDSAINLFGFSSSPSSSLPNALVSAALSESEHPLNNPNIASTEPPAYQLNNMPSATSLPPFATDANLVQAAPTRTVPKENNRRRISMWVKKSVSTSDVPSSSSSEPSPPPVPALPGNPEGDYKVLLAAFPGWEVPASSYVLGASAMGVVYGKDLKVRQVILNWQEGYQNIRLACLLSPKISSFTSLTVLQLNNHRIYGSLPVAIGNLRSLKDLSLAGNLISGPLPDSICDLANLEVLDLHDNQISAPLPIGFCRKLKNLNILRLNNNMITGGIPDDIGNLQNLQQLYLGHNRMDGPLPVSLGNLTKLELLQLQHNRFVGEIPSQLSQLKNLKFLFLNSNKLVGQLTGPMFSGLKSLEYLLLNRNQFNGDIPSALLSIKNIQILRLDNNYFVPPSKDKIPFGLKVGIQLGFKKCAVMFLTHVSYKILTKPTRNRIVLKPQFPGTPPYQIVPEYTEFPPDVLHPSDHIALQRSTRPGASARLITLYDLPDNPNRWSPTEVAFWAKISGGDEDLCRSILELTMTGAQFFRLGEDDLESALGVWDAGVRVVLFGRMQAVLAVANGLVPPSYDEVWGEGGAWDSGAMEGGSTGRASVETVG
ncbi:UNVERIFIED_CONTAM: hypothetical protein HDU68_011562 [Siphonaria sp. JEL0065]|nr:hypothetical protein HDU68_011562 [Siphonaria sp. JEL0065]